MKKRVKNKLLLLLSVRAGRCPDHVREKLARSLSGDPLLNRRLELVYHAWDRGNRPATRFDQRVEEGDVIFDPETIASFVEGRLEPELADIVTSSAWDSPALLAEICDIFRAVHGGEPITGEPGSPFSIDEGRLANRLTALFDERVNANGNGREAEIAKKENEAISRSSIHSGDSPGSPSGKKRVWSRITMVLAIAAAVVVIVRLLPPQNESAETGNPSADIGKLAEGKGKSTDGMSPGDQELANNQDSAPEAAGPADSTPGDEGLVEKRSPDGTQLSINKDRKDGSDLREPWDAFSGDRDPSEFVKSAGNEDRSQRKNGNESPKETAESGEAFTLVRENLRFELDQVKGVVGLYVEPKGLWRGYASSSNREFEDQATTVVFSGSWVRARIPDVGEWVLDADTEVRLTRESLVPDQPDDRTLANAALPVRPPQYRLELLSGRVGIENLPGNTDLAVRYMNREINVRAASGDTFIAFDAYGETPVLSVKRGKVEIDGELLPVGRSRLFNGESASPILPTRHSLRWLDRPESYVRLSAKLQAELLAADDLRDQFQRMVRQEEHGTKRAAGLWLMSVNPDLIAESLRRPDIDDWNLLMEWLAVQHRRGYRQRAVWVSLGEMVGDEQFGRQLFLWTRMLEFRQEPSVEQVDRFMTYLNHESLFARFAAGKILEDCFANPYQYEPTLSPERRIAATRAWRRHIIQLLGQ